MNRRDFIKSSTQCVVASALLSEIAGVAEAASPGAQARKPNVVVIVADDLGYAELGVYGGRDIPTPNIDSIAANGVRFTNGYVSCPVCSPTRAGLMTGRYQQRFGHEFNPGPGAVADPTFGLPLTETTLAERMKTLGYATWMVGKWHLGFQPEMNPTKRGFDDFFGFLGGGHSYFPSQGRKGSGILRGTGPVQETEYLTDAFAREAVVFIERHRTDPFFLYLPFNAVHEPLAAPEKYLSRFTNITDTKRRTFAAVLSAMDDSVGSVLRKLREAKLEENTLIFFISDNGGPTAQTSSSNVPLRGYKAEVLEGGVRIPFMVQWMGHLPAGKVYDNPVISLDIHPTAVAAAAGQIPAEAKLDGVSLLPYLSGKNAAAPHDRLLWRYGHQWAIRMNEWKLLHSQTGSPQLYNLSEDMGERNDLAAKNPDKVKELQTAYSAWNAELMVPRWQPSGGGRRQKQRKRRKQ